jgi:hypothetical protein
MEVTISNLDYATKYNQSIIKSVNYNKNRKKYFKVIHNMDVEKAIIKYTKVNFASRVKRKIVRVINSSNKNK